MHARRTFNQYEILDVLGEGGMGTVYKALDKSLLRNVALKVLKEEFSSNSDSITELAREAKITASINHPNVVKVFSFGEAYGQYFFAMELVEKGSLDDLMMLQKRVAEAQTLNIGIQIAQGLQAAYTKGLIHSDVKPGNILFADAKTAKIVDFGLAILQEQQADEKGEIWGTPYYVPPERLNKEKEDLRSDIYSLGGTLFHALAGRPPFEAENASLVALKHLKSKAVSLQAFAPDVSSETAYVINRMLQKNVDDRYGSYDELIEHLIYAREQLMAKVATGQPKRQAIQVESDQSKLVGGLATLGMLLVLVVVAIVAWRSLKPGVSESPPVRGASVTLQATSDREVVKRLAAARKLAAASDAGGALAELDAVSEYDSLRQPLRNWYLLERGLVLILDDRMDESAALFARLDAEDLFSRDPAQLSLANFFKETGRLMKDKRAISANAVTLFKSNNYEAIALLLFGVKNWELGNFESAGKILRAYANAQPTGADAWVKEFQPVADRLLGDYDRLAQLEKRLEQADSKQALQALIDDLKKSRATMTTGADLAALIAQLEIKASSALENFGKVVVATPTPAKAATATPTPKPTATPTPEPTPDAAAIATELAALGAINSEIKSHLAAGGGGASLRSKAAKITASSPAAQDRKEWLLRRLDWLLEFRSTLMADINAEGYEKPIPRRVGSPLAGKATSANAQELMISVPYGSMPLSWRDITPQTQVALAKHFLEKSPETKDKARRSWLIGIYAMEAGDSSTAKPLLIESAKEAPEFKDYLEKIFTGEE